LSGATILFTEMSPDMDWEDDFNHWYETHHIPVRAAVPGFVSAQRYCEPDRPNYLAVYEIESPDILQSAEYQKVRAQPNGQTAWMLSNAMNYSRYIGKETSTARRDGVDDSFLDTPFLYAVFFSVPDERAEEFNSWYDDEHVPLLLQSEHWLAVRRFEILEGEPQPWTHLAVHYLDAMAALSSPERDAARDTEWRKRLAEEPWFQSGTQVYESIGNRFPGIG
jgi:hypothetical protein